MFYRSSSNFISVFYLKFNFPAAQQSQQRNEGMMFNTV